MITSIYSENGLLRWDSSTLATREEYELADRCEGSIFEALSSGENVELKEGFFQLNKDLDLVKHPDEYSLILESALNYGKEKFPSAPIEHNAAFANAVAYLVTGASSGYGGPSCREHAVSWALSGKDGRQSQVETNLLGTLTIQHRDGSLPNPGQWEYKKALEFAEPFCYGALTQLHYECYQQEYCFDEAEEDIEAIKKLLGESESP